MLEILQNLLTREGYTISPPPEGTKGCTFVASRGSERIAVLAKQQKAKVNISQIQQFQEYLEMKRAGETTFTSGWIISSSGFFNTGLTLAQTEEPANLRLGTLADDRLTWHYPAIASNGSLPPKEPEPARNRVRYFGVFTCKGASGKRRQPRILPARLPYRVTTSFWWTSIRTRTSANCSSRT